MAVLRKLSPLQIPVDQMLIQILKGTPGWVFALFLGLLALGVAQSRPRLLAPTRVAMLPAAFLALSLWGVISAFGANLPSLGAWVAGIGAAVLLNRALKQPAGVRWDASQGGFHVPGSWLPLALMMAVFFARYAISVSLVMRPTLSGVPGFAASAGFAYGLFSGTFLARSLQIWRQRAGQSVQSSPIN